MDALILSEFERLDVLVDRTLLEPSTWAGAVFYAVLLALGAVTE